MTRADDEARPQERTGAQYLLSRFLSFPVLLGALLVFAVFVGTRKNLPDPDTWWHLVAGEEILATGSWPTADHYSFTVAGHDWIAYEWLGEVLMALVGRLGGFEPLAALLFGWSALLFVLLYYLACLRSGNSKAAFLACVVMIPLAAVVFSLRPQLLGYVFLVVTLICLEHYRQGRRAALWCLPLVFLLWVNTHGSFAVGVLVVGVYWLGGMVDFRWRGVAAEPWTRAQRRQWAVVLLLCAVALTLTPYGTKIVSYPLQMAFLQPVNIANISEWQPLSFQSVRGKMLLALVVAFFLVQMVSPITFRLEEIGLLLFALYAATTHRRFLIVLAVVFAPLLAAQLSRWVPGYRAGRDRYSLNALIMGVVIVCLLVFYPSPAELEEAVARRFPHQAVGYLKQHPLPEKLLNEYSWGGYLIWTLYPDRRVFIDGRTDIYEYGGVFADYLRIMDVSPDTQQLLRKYGVEACLLERKAALGTLLAALPGWEQVYEDDLSVVFVHNTGNAPGEAAQPPAALPVPGRGQNH